MFIHFPSPTVQFPELLKTKLLRILSQPSPRHQELERRTEMGLAMHNMLAKGQVVPFSMTLELLKGVANLTCSEKLVIQNCPQQLGMELMLMDGISMDIQKIYGLMLIYHDI